MCDAVNAFDSRACRRTALCTSSEATAARRSNSGSNFQSASTGKRLLVAPAVRLEGPGALSMHARASLPACFASPGALHFVPFYPILSHLDRRVPTASNVSCRPKSEQSPPTVSTIDLAASRTVTGGVDGEQRASIDCRPDGLGHG